MGLRATKANLGRALELAVLASQGTIVRLEKVGTATKWIGGGETIQVRSLPDFAGCFVGSGRGLFLDAKQSAEPRWPMSKTRAHQTARLVRWGEAGAVAGLLIESTLAGKYFWLDWRHLTTADRGIAWDDPRLLDLGHNKRVIRFERLLGA